MSAANFLPVSKAQFFAVVGPMDVHPRSERDYSEWVHQPSRNMVGKTTPGYMGTGESTYALREDLARKATGSAA